MAYYGQRSMNRGDYYRGDYYRGDLFGAIGGFFKKVAGVAIPSAIGFLTGGPAGALVGAAKGTFSTTRRGITEETLAAGGTGTALTPELVAGHQAALARARLDPFGRGVTPMPGGALPLPPGGMLGGRGMGVAGLRRVHPNKSTYVTRGGGTSHWPPGLVIHPKGTELVPSRRLNVGNARALRRALRRARGFAKLAHKVLRVTHQFKGKGLARRKRAR